MESSQHLIVCSDNVVLVLSFLVTGKFVISVVITYNSGSLYFDL